MKIKKRTLLAFLLLVVNLVFLVSEVKFISILFRVKTFGNLVLPKFLMGLVQSIILIVCSIMMFAKATDKTIVKTLSVYFGLIGLIFAVFGTACLLGYGKDNSDDVILFSVIAGIVGVIYIVIAFAYIITAILGVLSAKNKPHPVLIGLFLVADVVAKLVLENRSVNPYNFILFITLCGIYFYSSKNIYNNLKQLEQEK